MPVFEVTRQSEVARLVQFSTGKINPEAKDQIKFKCHHVKDSVKSNKQKTVVTTEIKGIQFSGQNYGTSNHFSTETCDYYVGVQRKGSDKIQVLPAELFQLTPQFEDPAETPQNEQLSQNGQTPQTMWDKRNQLVGQFGSGQMQRRVNKILQQKMEEDALAATAESMATGFASKEKAKQATQVGEPVEKTENKVESSVVPPHNKEATKPEDVYALDTIIPGWVWDALVEQSQEFVSCTSDNIAQWRQYKVYPELVLNLLDRLPSTEEERSFQCPIIMYINCLLHFYLLKYHELQKKVGRYPDTWKGHVKKMLEDTFTVMVVDTQGRSRRTRPSHLKDLVLSHVLVLYLRLSNYQIALKPLVADTKISIKRISLHATMLGCKVKNQKSLSGEQISTAVLTVPFELPDQVKKGPPKRRI